ncbi:2-phospho-L-lactate transferase [Nocardioides sp. CPCC 206347]|uniref:2-phospho-L-lactate transferase n=1 Tax=unclassified Nocardioides TaxID=2615069 RepID=UPI003609BEB4
MRVVGLGGGIGASRLWTIMIDPARHLDLTVAVNTGEDLWLHGLRVCPDLDTVLYALSGRQDTSRGWGVKEETWQCMTTLSEIAGNQWFNLGDRDLAVHLFRTGQLRAGHRLSDITSEIARAFQVGCKILPATEAEVTSRVVTCDGRDLHYQEFLVREHADVDVLRSYVAGMDDAQPVEGLLDDISAADLVVIAPSNPIASLQPILQLQGMRAALQSARQRTVVVSPTVETVPIDDEGEAGRARSRARLLKAAGYEPTPVGVALFYADVAGVFVLDRADAAFANEIEAVGLRVVLADTLVHRGADPGLLVDAVLSGVENAELR